MNPRIFLTCFFTAALFITAPVFAGNGQHGGGGGRPAMARSAPRGASAIGSGARLAGMNRAYAGNFRRSNNTTGLQRVNNWNGNGNWNGNHNWVHNGNNWNHHRCGNGVVFIGGFGFPWFDPFYYGSYYPYGAYPADYPYYSDNPGQPYYGNEGDGSYDDKNPVNGAYTPSNGSIVAQVQRRLAHDGYYQGVIDGKLGPRTFYAIRAYERAHGLPADGHIDRRLLSTMGLG